MQPRIFGEVLFDCFPDGSEVLGGAPFNVAWHLQGFGVSPLMISQVGDDVLGEKVLETMQAWDMDTTALGTDPYHATGRVDIELDDGQPTFTIAPDQAWDHIPAGLATCSGDDILYHGSLAARNAVSMDSLEQLKQQAGSIFVDINLRDPWWSPASVKTLMQGARWAKLNEIELGILVDQPELSGEALQTAARNYAKDFGLEWLIITMGAEGAFVITPESLVTIPPVRVDNIADTVGAGDSFSAVTLFGIMNDWPVDKTLRQASEFAARICQQRGATHMDRDLYQNFLATAAQD